MATECKSIAIAAGKAQLFTGTKPERQLAVQPSREAELRYLKLELTVYAVVVVYARYPRGIFS